MEPLSRLLLITNRHLMQPDFETALEGALLGGARLIQLREKDLPPRGVLRLAHNAAKICERFGAGLLVNSRADIAAVVSAGVHLPENDISASDARRVLGDNALCGVSVHSVDAAKRAAGEGADYLVFGSVFPTTSHLGETAQGLMNLQQVARAVSCPVYAVGGIDAATAPDCLAAGAHGVAVISAVWSTPDVTGAVRVLRHALGDE